MFRFGKNIRSGTRCRPFYLVLATALAWAILSAHAGPGPEPGADQPQLSVMVLPAITGDDDQARGPQIAVRWSGELPVQLQSGFEDASGRWQARGEPIELNEPMSLLPAPDQVDNGVFTPVLHKFRPNFGLGSVPQGIKNTQHVGLDGCIGIQ